MEYFRTLQLVMHFLLQVVVVYAPWYSTVQYRTLLLLVSCSKWQVHGRRACCFIFAFVSHGLHRSILPLLNKRCSCINLKFPVAGNVVYFRMLLRYITVYLHTHCRSTVLYTEHNAVLYRIVEDILSLYLHRIAHGRSIIPPLHGATQVMV